MRQLKAAARHRPRALTMLLLIVMLLTASSMWFAANAVSQIRGDFCAWAAEHVQAAQEPPHTARALKNARADRQLATRLGCPGTEGKP